MKTKTKALDYALAVLMVLLFVCMATVLVLNFRPLYYFDITHLDIPAISHLSHEEIRSNYDVLIAYNSVFFRGELQFPSLAMSPTGRIHFEEVKNIFVAMQITLAVLAVAMPFAIVKKLKQKEITFLKLSALFGIGIPLTLGALVALNWERVFILFHEMVFRNAYWQFNEHTDPVITILPSEFFMHCAIAIIAIVFVCSLLCLLFYKKLQKAKR